MSNNNKTFIKNVWENLEELGKSTARETQKAVTEIVNPLEPLMRSSESDKTDEMKKMEEQAKKDSSTPLDFNKLDGKYKDQDKAKLEALKRRYFDIVVSGTNQVIQENKQRTQQKQQHEAELQEEQQRKVEEARAQQGMEQPQGKVKKSIMGGGKKKANPGMEQHQEYKPASKKG